MKDINIKTIVGAGLLLFVFIFGNIIMMGLFNTINGMSVAMFKTLYFVFLIIILGIIYFSVTHLIKSNMERTIMVFSVLIFSAGLATAAGSLKNIQDSSVVDLENINAMQAQNNYYLQYINSMTALEESIKANNRVLEADIVKLSDKINNKTPIVVETIITIPGEIIYEEEPPIVPVVNREYEEYEEDD